MYLVGLLTPTMALSMFMQHQILRYALDTTNARILAAHI